jgi:CBS domain containing-hemolysin-like protein
MKKFLALLFVLICSFSFAANLSADTVAAEPSIMDSILKALLAALLSFLSYLSTALIPLINQWLKQMMHFRGSSVVADALTQAMGELIVETQKALADGVITEAERKTLKARAGEIARERLKNLSGFYKKDLTTWVDDQLDVLLGKLLSRI